MVTYDIYFNSGSFDRETHYSKGSNVSLVQISQSDQEYYQTGTIIVYNTPSSQNIGDSVMVFIDNCLEFDGYVSNRQRSLKGVIEDKYQLVGRTYDLWRYHTNSDTSYSNKTTAYIASSLVGTFCIGVSGTNIDTTTGVDVTDTIDFNNEIIGDALTRISKMDGFIFYVDNDGQLVYESRGDAIYMLNVQESDIIEMQPIEESDEDLVNDVLIIGGSNYSYRTFTTHNKSSQCIAGGDMLYAQKFRAEDSTLSAVKMYLGRTLDPFEPDNLEFEIWENTEKTVFTDTFDNWDYLLSGNDNHWNMLVEDGYLQLGYSEQTVSNTVASPVGSYSADYVGQTFEFGIDVTLYKAGIWAKCDSITDGWIEIRGTTGSPPEPDPSNILCSGAISITNTNNSYWEVVLSPQVKIFNGTRYAIVLHDNDQSNFRLYYNDAEPEYTDGAICYSNNDSSWTAFADVGTDCSFYIEGKAYKTSGQIESICYSGQYTNEISGYDCQYIKLDLQDTTSSNRIYISGTNNSGGTWKSLTDNTWEDLVNEDHSVKVKYIFSSNGNYTPKLGTSELKISDDSAGFETQIFSDLFEDDSNIDTGASDTFYLNTDYKTDTIQISGLGITYASGTSIYISSYNTISEASYESCMLGGNVPNCNLSNWDKPFDGDESTYGYGPSLGSPYTNYYELIQMHLTNNSYLFNDWSKRDIQDGGHSLHEGTLWLSGSWTDQCLGYNKQLGDYCYSGINTILKWWIHKWYKTGEGSHETKLYEYKLKLLKSTLNDFSKKIIYTNVFDTADDMEYIQATWTANPATTISGSSDNGANWVKLVNGAKTSISNAGTQVQLMYCLTSGISMNYKVSPSSNIGTSFPYLESIEVLGYTNTAGGLPKSGTKVQWSQDISFSDTDIPYPPSYSSWQTYSEPKLRLDDGQYYWIVLDGKSGSADEQENKYWSFNYNVGSTYDYGGITMSWNDGTSWSSNITDSTHVPSGDMVFDLGWTQGDITATAYNQDSINSFGRHFKKITDSNITSLDEAQARADLEISGMLTAPKKGTLTINGTTDVDLTYKLSGSFANFNINEKMDIVSYTQTIDNRGFTTQVTYGKRQFDLAKEVAEIKRELS